MQNYWTEKIAFKKKIEDDLYPLLKKFLGQQLTDENVDKIKDKVSDWLNDVNDALFDCSITFELERKTQSGTNSPTGTIDIIKFIRVIPVDA
jgi:hypothetical protein